MTDRTETLEGMLEALVDRHGLGNVVDMLGFICDEKAEHIAHNWQDASLAKLWIKAGKACAIAHTHIVCLGGKL